MLRFSPVTPHRPAFAAILLTAFCFIEVVLAQTTAFTYQGKLTEAGNPANVNYDLQFRVFDETLGGTQQGTTLIHTPVATHLG